MRKIFLAPVIIFFFVAAFFLVNILPPRRTPSPTAFVINQGDSLAVIARRLYQHHLIRQPQVFIFYSYILGLNKSLQAGNFQLSPSLSASQVIHKLSQGGSHDYWFKILEGWRLEEIAANLPPQANFTSSQFLSALKAKEGYLFPDSYLIPPDYTLEQLLHLISQNFDKKFSQAKQDRTTDLDDFSTLILASLLEREAKSTQDRCLVAGVLLTRLNIGMALQVDATIQYVRDSRVAPSQYWSPPGSADLKINSPYNTYQNKGLPPGPICSPGLDALSSAFHPTTSDYLYYLTGTDGRMYYARNFEEHTANIAQYLR